MTPTIDPLFIAFQTALAGRYSLDREIGRGGMGIVFLAREVHLDRPVAIKLLPPERARDATLRERFLREARMAAKLSHPNVIPIHAVDAIGDFVFYVMSFVDGETLAERVRHRGPMPASDGTRVIRDAAFALAYAHSQGLVHRDVKPDNILIESGTGRVLVADFGIASVANDAETGVAGTPEFMSPEQALGKELDGRSDVYSLGVTAYYAFTGRIPFEGATPTEIIAKHVATPAPPIGSIGVSVPRRVATVIDRCLSKDPGNRPATAQTVGEHLGAALEHRREIPVALRAFAKRDGRFDGGGTLLYPFVALAGATIVSAFFGTQAGIAAFAASLIGAPVVAGVLAARGLVRAGFAHKDIAPAFKAELEIAREERLHDRASDPSRWERLLSTGSKLLLSMGALGFGFGLVDTLGNPLRIAYVGTIASTLVTAGALGVPLGIANLLAVQKRRDVDTEFWARIWTGRFGRFAFSLAKRITPQRAIKASMTHRPTELSLGLAVDALYESLPRATRDEIGDVPAAARALENDAQRLRALLEEMNTALSMVGESESSVEYLATRADRDRVQSKMTDVVGALETIRLNLLRLHAGSETVEHFTTHLGLAADVNLEVERLLAAQTEVDRSLKTFPRPIEPTPA